MLPCFSGEVSVAKTIPTLVLILVGGMCLYPQSVCDTGLLPGWLVSLVVEALASASLPTPSLRHAGLGAAGCLLLPVSLCFPAVPSSVVVPVAHAFFPSPSFPPSTHFSLPSFLPSKYRVPPCHSGSPHSWSQVEKASTLLSCSISQK